MTIVRTLLKTAALGAALLTSTSAFAQWQGTWDTSYGRIKLQQTGKYVHGDYGNWGTVEGLLNDDNRTIRGLYRRNDDGTYGFFEWRLNTGSSFTGRWQNDRLPVPRWNSRGSLWKGKRQNGEKPNLSVYAGNGDVVAFLRTAGPKYKAWISVINADAPKPAAMASAQSANRPTQHPLASRIPMFKGYSTTFKPRYFQVHLSRIFSVTEAGQDELYGLAGIYATCELPNRSYRLTPFGGRKNQVLNVSRKNAIKGNIELNENVGALRFKLDEACLANKDARISIQVQTNIKERDLRPALDDKWGYKAIKVYLDQIEDGAKFCCEPSIDIKKADGASWGVRGVLGKPRGRGEPLMIKFGSVHFDVSFVR